MEAMNKDKRKLPSETKALREEMRKIVARGPFLTVKDKNKYRAHQKKAGEEMEQAISDVWIGATQSAEILMESAMRHVKSMREIIQKGRQ